MAITFNTNLAAMGAQRNIGIASNSATSSLNKLSSGSRIPQAKDDAAGLAIGSKLKSEVAGLTQASNNAAQAISLLQIADGALSTLGDILQRMKALAVQSSSGQLDDASRSLLNQEFSNLKSEVDRVANVTNFNGTTLLAGSTKVEAKVNDMGAANLIGEGFEKIEFAQDYGAGAVKIDYDKDTKVMTVKDLVNNKSQSITLSDTDIAVGDNEVYNFGDIGVKITLNSNFDKAVDIAAANTAVSAGAVTGTSTMTATGATFGTLTFTNLVLGSGDMALADLDTKAINATGTYDAATFSDLTVGTHVFHTDDVVDLSTAGAFTLDFSDGDGNSFTIGFTTTGNATAGAFGGAFTLDASNTATGAIEATGTGANAPSIVSVTEDSGVGAVPFNFGTVDSGKLTIVAGDATAATATMTQNGVVFSTENTGGSHADMSTTGVKTLKLADANGNIMEVQFNVTTAFVDGESSILTLNQLGQVVAANSVTSGSTTFNFKVGTGVSDNDKIGFSLNSATTTALGINGDDILTAGNADTAIGHVNTAITAVASRRADVGAAQSRLDFASNSISVAIENTTAAQSALLDVDVSTEITKFTNENVLMQAGISLLSQANQQPALLLRLLQ